MNNRLVSRLEFDTFRKPEEGFFRGYARAFTINACQHKTCDALSNVEVMF